MWTGDPALPPEGQGLVVLGTPVGNAAFVANRMEQVSSEHAALLRAIHTLPELQSAWLLLSLCANPRSNYFLRTLPPSQSAPFARRHDAAILEALLALLDRPGAGADDLEKASVLAQLPLIRFDCSSVRCYLYGIVLAFEEMCLPWCCVADA